MPFYELLSSVIWPAARLRVPCVLTSVYVRGWSAEMAGDGKLLESLNISL